MSSSQSVVSSGQPVPSDRLAEVLAAAYRHGPGKEVRPGPAPVGHRRPAGTAAVSFADLARSGPTGERLVRVLRTALAPRRFEPWNGFNEHRAYPSPRAAYLVDVALRTDAGDWRVDPVRDLLHPPTPTSTADFGATGSVQLALLTRPQRMPAGYGPLADALAELEAGHVAGALVEAAAGHGLRVTAGPGPLTSVGAAADAHDGLTIAVGPPVTPAWPRRRLTAVRSSGLGPRGFGPDPRPLPAEVFDRLVAAAYQLPPGSPAAWPGLRHAVAVGNVAGRTTGWLDLEPAGPAAGPAIRPADAIGQLQRAYSYPRSEVDVAGLPLAWLVSADIGASVRSGGPTAYRRLLHSAGALAQHVGTAAAMAGLFCRPVRAVREGTAEAAAGLPAGHDLIYLLLIGRSRVRDFAYDLSNPEVSL
ncbi:nitroreductase family protein [Micromonospora sp. NBC_01813]|uniref:nitroreductase family protein n=1 Tax=Micromonospora sp. NBC_01813 TaxID=2975988 RepID=UPI002DDBDDAA|nr:nitroreductase family protein [Micromonospora sp. NBC_01813]WSA11850.1 nitroreductase family protein [Micromonospora sp. NBC_01813]